MASSFNYITTISMLGEEVTFVSWLLWFALAAALAMAAIITFLGIHVIQSDNTSSATFIEIMSHAAGCLALLMGMLFVVPEYIKAFDEFDIDLPPQTILLIEVSKRLVRYLPFWVLALAVLLVADAGVFRALHAKESTRTLAKLWSGGITSLIVLSFLFSVGAILSSAIVLVAPL